MTDNSRVRVSIVGVVVVALFSALFARLWFLQVGSGEEFQVVAVERTTRVIQTEMPRGRILDRDGEVLVENRRVWALTVDRELPKGDRRRVLGQLSELFGTPYTRERLEENFADLRQSPLQPAVVAVDIPEDVRVAVLERRDQYPGVEVEKIMVRTYPHGRLAAHALGYVGEINSEQLDKLRDDGYLEGDSIGRAGIERAYESELRGAPRRETVEVDPTGRQVGPPIDVEPGSVGNDVALTLDADVQQLAEESLLQAILRARTQENENVDDRFELLKAPAGAVVVLDARDGSVVALASYPDYDPTQFVDGISQAEFDRLQSPQLYQPLVNRATQGVYAPGSTFKVVTSVAGTRFGIRPPGVWINDPGHVEIRGTDFQNASRQAHGNVDLAKAIAVSSDVYFYTLGWEFWKTWKDGDTQTGLGLQDASRDLGFGANTGVEVDESTGTVPDPDWKRELAYKIWDTDKEKRENAIWYPADNILMAVGQGGMGVTPLQLTNAYAAFANGGTLWQPHVGKVVTDADGKVVRTVKPKEIRKVAIDAATAGSMLNGFTRAVGNEEGTAYYAFSGFPLDQIPVAGKTGTAQVEGKGDSSLFVGFFPAQAPKYVVAAVIEEGGRGARIAAPLVRRVIEGMNHLQLSTIQVNQQGID